MKGSYEVVERSEQEIGGNEDLLTIIDIDRCILNSQYFFELVTAALRTLGVTDATLDQVIRDEADNRGNAFDYIAEIRRQEPQALLSVETLVNFLLEAHDHRELAHRIFAPGAIALVRTTKSTKSHALFLTAGGVDTQRVKLGVINKLLGEMTSLNTGIPWMIIDDNQQRKTGLADEAYDRATQTFSYRVLCSYALASSDDIPEQADGITEVMVLDDKLQNVTAQGAGITGVHIARAESGDRPVEGRTLIEASNILMQRAIESKPRS